MQGLPILAVKYKWNWCHGGLGQLLGTLRAWKQVIGPAMLNCGINPVWKTFEKPRIPYPYHVIANGDSAWDLGQKTQFSSRLRTIAYLQNISLWTSKSSEGREAQANFREKNLHVLVYFIFRFHFWGGDENEWQVLWKRFKEEGMTEGLHRRLQKVSHLYVNLVLILTNVVDVSPWQEHRAERGGFSLYKIF